MPRWRPVTNTFLFFSSIVTSSSWRSVGHPRLAWSSFSLERVLSIFFRNQSRPYLDQFQSLHLLQTLESSQSDPLETNDPSLDELIKLWFHWFHDLCFCIHNQRQAKVLKSNFQVRSLVFTGRNETGRMERTRDIQRNQPFCPCFLQEFNCMSQLQPLHQSDLGGVLLS